MAAVNRDGTPLEIERKFLIRMPDRALLDKLCQSRWQITQFYAQGGARGRRIDDGAAVTYVETKKEYVSDLVRVEAEREITKEEYEALLALREPRRRVLEKTRWRIPFEGQLLEVDVFPFWDDRAFCEVELESEDQEVNLPPWLTVIREVTGERRYNNRSLALRVPREPIGSRSAVNS